MAGVAVSDRLAAGVAAGSAVDLVDSAAAAVVVGSGDSAAVAAVEAAGGDPGRWFVVGGSWLFVCKC